MQRSGAIFAVAESYLQLAIIVTMCSFELSRKPRGPFLFSIDNDVSWHFSYNEFMAKILASVKVEKKDLLPDDLLTDVRAQVVSPGGAVILAVAIILTLILFFSLYIPSIQGMQFVIVAVLTIGCWGYLLNSFTETLRVENGRLEFRAWMSRTKHIDLQDVNGIKLTDLGIRLNGDQYLFEVLTTQDSKPVQISLGPCWDRRHLMNFIKTMQILLDELNND